jgi:hypothetical protein
LGEKIGLSCRSAGKLCRLFEGYVILSSPSAV